MKVEIGKNAVTITREPGDKKIYKESTFFYLVKQELIKQGHDVIVKCPSKDKAFFHLTSMPFYIRSRKYRKGVTSFWIVDNNSAIYLVYEDYNKEGITMLGIEYNIFDKDKEPAK